MLVNSGRPVLLNLDAPEPTRRKSQSGTWHEVEDLPHPIVSNNEPANFDPGEYMQSESYQLFVAARRKSDAEFLANQDDDLPVLEHPRIMRRKR